MKKTILLSALLTAAFSYYGHATIWTIANSGDVFSPANVTIATGDTVVFNITNNHDAVEVSQSTYAANGNTPLANGFTTPFGGGTILPAQLAAGQHWFVCTPHAVMGMKGIITVSAPTSITDVLAKTEINVSPNPSSNRITVSSSMSLKGVHYFLTDISGKNLGTGLLNESETTIDIQALPVGNYFLQIGNGIAKRTIQIAKQ